MLHVRAAGTSRQAVILAGVLAFHFGLFVVVAGIEIRGPIDVPPDPPKIIRVVPPRQPPVIKPAPPAPWEFGQTPVERPQPIEFPQNDPAPTAADDTISVASGSGPAIVPSADVFAGPTIAMDPRRLAALIAACYPASSRRMGEEGKALVRVMLGADGRVVSWRLLQSTGFPRLDAAVPCVIGHIQFQAGTRNGLAVPSEVDLPVVFRLN